MKTAIITYILVLLASVASAEIYRWEDANGIHFTDDSASVPEKYFDKDVAEFKAHSRNSGQQGNVGIARQFSLAEKQEQQAATHLANQEQHRRTAEVKRQLQINSRDFEDTLQSLAKFIVIWILLGMCLFIVWVGIIVDIARSTFITSTLKTVWMLLVLLLPLLGMLFYLILGSKQKYTSSENWGQGLTAPVT
jgi:uncharacterized membrane protein